MKNVIRSTYLELSVGLLLLVAELASATLAQDGGRFRDWKDIGCRMSPGTPGAPPSGAENAGGNEAYCATCPGPQGLCRWIVDQPDVNLWLTDQPLTYFTSASKEVAFRWYYKQRFSLPLPDECFTLYHWGYSTNQVARFPDQAFYSRQYGMSNAGWGHNWQMSIMVWAYDWEAISDYSVRISTPVFSRGYEALVFRPEGGIWYFYSTNTQTMLTEALSRVSLQPLSTYPLVAKPPQPDGNGVYWGDPGRGFKLSYPDGSQDIFGLTHYYWPTTLTLQNPSSTAQALLTQRVDPDGRVTLLGYQNVVFGSYSALRLKYVVDPDGRTNVFTYNTNSPAHPFELAEVQDAYGRKAGFNYVNGVLSAITDAANNQSSFAYRGPDGWITNLTTPYGTHSFSYYQVPNTNIPNGFWERAVYVSEPEGARQLFLYLHYTNLVAAADTAPTVPGQSFDDGTAGGSAGSLAYRNSFHWDRRQFSALSSNVVYWLTNTLPSNTNPLSNALPRLTAADYKKARLKHWLLSAVDQLTISQSLSSEREPSPDAGGTIEGLRTWYNYPSKSPSSPEVEGGAEVSCIALRLPDGSSQYSTFNFEGSRWDDAQSITLPGGSTGVLTNYYQYGANGIDLVTLSNSAGQSLSLAYNANHQVTNTIDALNQVSKFAWNPTTRNLTNISLSSGQSVSLSYYPAGPPNNPPTSSNSMLASITFLPQGRTLEFREYTHGLPRVIRHSGTEVPELSLTHFWDGLNRLMGTVFPDTTTVSNIYQHLGLVARKDRMGSWTYFGYDGLENPTWVQDARSNTTYFGWCDCGSLTSITDASNRVTSFFYNNQGLLTNIVFPDATQKLSRTNFFDSAGRLWKVSDGENRAFTLGYNNQGLVTAVSNAYGRVWQVVYDALNRPWTITDADNVTVTNQFDLLNRLTRRTWQDGVGETFGYSTNGLVAYTNRNGKITRLTRDAAGRLLYLTNANLEITRYAYNALDQVTDLWDGLTNHTGFGYNEFGWFMSKSNALGQEVLRLLRDPNGQVTNRWTPQFGNTSFRHDPAGNLTNVTWTSPQPGSIGYSYDKLNRLSGMSDALGTTAFAYTGNGELASESGPWTDDLVSRVYKQGHRVSLGIGDSSYNFWQSYTSDAAWRLTNLTSSAGAFLYGYGGANPASALVRTLVLPNFASITNHYDSLGRLDYTALQDRWGHPLDGYGYTHDLLGLRTNIVRELGITTNSVAVGYDAIGQLISWKAKEMTGASRLHEQLGLVFDKAGNLRYRTNGALVQTFTNNPLNQLTNISRSGTLTASGTTPAPASSVTVNGQSAERYGDFTFARTNLSLTGNDTFTIIAQNQFGSATNSAAYNLPASVALKWDANGNLTNDGTRIFVYNADNRLVTNWVANAWKTEFVYDGLGRRRIMREYGWQAGQWVKTNEVAYVCDGFLPIQERDGNNIVRLSYTRGPDLSGSLQGAGGIGGQLARTDANGSLFYHADGAGNVTALMDMAGNVAGRYQYGPFGRLSGMWGSMAPANVMRFSSMPYHDKGGMVGYYSRFYDPNLQRWTTQDPIGELGGINLYPFVRNDPLSYVDPYGQDFHVVHASGIQAPGPFGYLSGDTDIENLLAGGYNVVPQVGNVVASAMQGLGLLMQGAVDLAKTGARALGADPGTEDLIGRGVEAAMVVFPLGRAGKCERLLAAEEAAGVQANKLAGDAIRDAIAAREAPALTEHVFNTVGGVRRTDVLRLGNELVGIESKVGRTALDSRVRQELARDWWLQRQGQLDRIMWEFSPSEVTGQVGPTRQLAEKLGRLGFDMRINQ